MSKTDLHPIAKSFRIIKKHEKLYSLYLRVKSFSHYKGQIIRVKYFIENQDDHVKFYLVEKDFNYYREEKKSYNEYYNFGDFFDEFIYNGTMKEIQKVAIFDTTVECHQDSYGIKKSA